MLNVTLLLLLAAFITTVVSGMGKCPLWIPVLLLVLLHLLAVLPN